MSRICGVFASCGATVGNATVVAQMLTALPGRAALQADAAVARFGSTGRQSSLASEGGYLVAIDGHVFVDTVPGAASPAVGIAAQLLATFRQMGFEKTLESIDGAFAIAYFDPVSRCLWLARDRFGVKPLYYAEIREGFLFASQPVALLTSSGISCELNRQFVGLFAGSHYRTIDNAPHESPYAHVSQLSAAHLVKVVNAGASTPKPYWSLAPVDLGSSNEKELAEQYRDLIVKAVRRRLGASNRPAFTLSGGLDSSTILATASMLVGAPCDAFSSVYADPTYDERNEIVDMLDAGLVRWNPIEFDNEVDVFSAINRLVRIHNEPVATATWLAHEQIGGAVAAAGYGSLFGGLGGDEMNAGEYEYFPFAFADLIKSGQRDRLDNEIDLWARYHDHPIHRKNRLAGYRAIEKFADLERAGICRPDMERVCKYADAVDPAFFDVAAFSPIMEHPFRSYLANRVYQDLTRETTPCCLRAEDRHMAHHGLSSFDPFLDKDLAAFMISVPSHLKIRDGVTKYLLRKSTANVLPEKTRTRVKKTGWNAPAHMWFSGRALDLLRDMVNSVAFRQRGIYRLQRVIEIIDDHARALVADKPVENHMMFLWQLLNLELWQRWLDSRDITGHIVGIESAAGSELV